MTKAIPVAIFMLIHQVIAAQPDIENPPQKNLKILSWNIYMLPRLVAAHSGKKERAQAIGEIFRDSDYDILFFQEAFHPMARKKILNQLKKKFPYQAGPANRKAFSLKTNSGLWVFSRYPILKSKAIVYRTRYGIDALSRKGALLVEIDVNGQRIQVAGTHLQNCGPVWLRKAQCVEFYERLLKPSVRDGVPQIICGDFNIDRYSVHENYHSMLQALDAEDSNPDAAEYSYDRLHNDLHVEKGQRRDLIDYVLVRSNGVAMVCKNKVNAIKRRWHSRYADLSDHYSLLAEISFLNNVPMKSVASLKISTFIHQFR